MVTPTKIRERMDTGKYFYSSLIAQPMISSKSTSKGFNFLSKFIISAYGVHRTKEDFPFCRTVTPTEFWVFNCNVTDLAWTENHCENLNRSNNYDCCTFDLFRLLSGTKVKTALGLYKCHWVTEAIFSQGARKLMYTATTAALCST